RRPAGAAGRTHAHRVRGVARRRGRGPSLILTSGAFGHNAAADNERFERMNLLFRSLTLAGLRGRLRGMFNLNDPRWGRGEDKNNDRDRNARKDGKGPNQGPPDLDELWRDFNRKLGGLFGGRKGGSGGSFGGGGNGNFQPDMKSAG